MGTMASVTLHNLLEIVLERFALLAVTVASSMKGHSARLKYLWIVS